jgi:hypothetical protein
MSQMLYAQSRRGDREQRHDQRREDEPDAGRRNDEVPADRQEDREPPRPNRVESEVRKDRRGS